MDEYYTWDAGSVWHKHWPEFMYNWNTGSMWCKVLPHKRYVGLWHTFHGPEILPYILKTVWWINAITGILLPCDAKIYLIKYMWVSDLHFMVQWFCLISWRLLNGLMLYWRYWFSVTQTLNKTIYVGQWPVRHGSVILPCILKAIWWTNVIIGILEPYDAKIYHIKCMWVSDLHFMVQWFCLISWRLLDGLMLYWRYWFNVTQTSNWVGQWSIFHGPVILPYIWKTIWWTNVIIGILDPSDTKI